MTSQTTKIVFQINNAKLHVQVVTVSINDNIKFLETSSLAPLIRCY